MNIMDSNKDQKKIKIEEILKESFNTAKDAINHAKKAANVGTKKLSIYMLRNKLKDALSDLGSVVYRILVEEKQENIDLSIKPVKTVIDEIEKIKLEIMAIETKIKDIKEKV
jgi:hypothetical protein